MKLLSAKYSNSEHTTIRAEVYLNEVITSTHIYVNIHDIHDSGNMKMIQEWEVLGNNIEPFETAEEIAEREKTEANQVILQELEEIDRLSIRDIREWIANQPSAPQLLKDREAQAILKRGQLQP